MLKEEDPDGYKTDPLYIKTLENYKTMLQASINADCTAPMAMVINLLDDQQHILPAAKKMKLIVATSSPMSTVSSASGINATSSSSRPAYGTSSTASVVNGSSSSSSSTYVTSSGRGDSTSPPFMALCELHGCVTDCWGECEICHAAFCEPHFPASLHNCR